MRNRWEWCFLTGLVCLSFLNGGCEKSGRTGNLSSANPKAGSPTIHFQDKLYDVSVADKGNVWVVGYYGAIFHSNDGGKSWSRQNSETSDSLLGVDFVTDHQGWVVGESGMILHTKDGGTKWEKQLSPVPDERLLKVQFVNERDGWAAGSNGVIIRTLDGGAHWERLPFRGDVTLNDFHFLNTSEGWVAGEFETILHTTNGGKTWQKQRGDKAGKLFYYGTRLEKNVQV
jgi:photosystem II stability/assembly factor-like uncharacterized protein